MGFLSWLFGKKQKQVVTIKKNPPESNTRVLANPKNPSPKPTLKEARVIPDKPTGVNNSVVDDGLYLMTVFPEDLTPVYSESSPARDLPNLSNVFISEELNKIYIPVEPTPVAEVSSNHEVVHSPVYESHSSSYDSGSSSSYDSSSSSCDSGSCGGGCD